MTDLELIKKIAEGKNELFKVLVDKYQKNVINICNGFVHDIDTAKDIAQEVFIEIWKSAEKFRGESKLSTWVYKISVNKSINYINKNKKFQKEDIYSTSSERKISEISSDEINAKETETEISEKLKTINSIIDKLPENQRTAFILSKYNELSYKKISESMQISVSSVESLIHRAKVNIQNNLVSFYKKNKKYRKF